MMEGGVELVSIGSESSLADVLKYIRAIPDPKFEKKFHVNLLHQDGKKILEVNFKRRDSVVEISGSYDDGITVPKDIISFGDLNWLIKKHGDSLEKEIVQTLTNYLHDHGYKQPIEIEIPPSQSVASAIPMKIPAPKFPPVTREEIENKIQKLGEKNRVLNDMEKEVSDLVEKNQLIGFAEIAGIAIDDIELIAKNPGLLDPILDDINRIFNERLMQYTKVIHQLKKNVKLVEATEKILEKREQERTTVLLVGNSESYLRDMLKDTGPVIFGERLIDDRFDVRWLSEAVIHDPIHFQEFNKELSTKYFNVHQKDIVDWIAYAATEYGLERSVLHDFIAVLRNKYVERMTIKLKGKLKGSKDIKEALRMFDRTIEEIKKIELMYKKSDKITKELTQLSDELKQPIDPTNLDEFKNKRRKAEELLKELGTATKNLPLQTESIGYQSLGLTFVEYAKKIPGILNSNKKLKLLYDESLIHLPELGRLGTLALYSFMRGEFQLFLKQGKKHLQNNYKKYPYIHPKKDRFYAPLTKLIKRKRPPNIYPETTNLAENLSRKKAVKSVR